MAESSQMVVGLSAVIIALSGEEPNIVTVSASADPLVDTDCPGPIVEEVQKIEALPAGPLDPTGDRTLERALRRWVRTSAGLELGYVEQLYTFGDRFRNPHERVGGPREITAAYLALVRQGAEENPTKATWRSIYRFFPWEDGREARLPLVEQHIEPALRKWIGEATTPAGRSERRERAWVVFGLHDSPWDAEKVLDRYELLYEIGLVPESMRDRAPIGSSTADAPWRKTPWVTGLEMALDHRRILATALGRIRAKIKYRPVVFELMPETFTLFQLQRGVEALAGARLHKQNFRRLVEQGGLVEGTGRLDHGTGGRPAELFRFRREVVLERPAPGVGVRRG